MVLVKELIKVLSVSSRCREGVTMTEWKQERPKWCPHIDCIFKRRVQDGFCGGYLPVPQEHDGDYNTYRVCLRTDEALADFMVNKTDLEWLRWLFDALDGRQTSWLSKVDTKNKENMENFVASIKRVNSWLPLYYSKWEGGWTCGLTLAHLNSGPTSLVLHLLKLSLHVGAGVE